MSKKKKGALPGMASYEAPEIAKLALRSRFLVIGLQVETLI